MENDNDNLEKPLYAPEQIKEAAFTAFSRIQWPRRCAILAYPDYPNIGTHRLIPGPYNKMEDFYRSWTHGIPFCRYVSRADQIKQVVESLQAESPERNRNETTHIRTIRKGSIAPLDD